MLHPNLARDRSLAFSASISRSRGGAIVTNEPSNLSAALVT